MPSRVRKQGYLSNAYLQVKDFGPAGDLQSDTNYPSTRKSSGTFKTMADVTTPGAKKAMASGAILMGPLTIDYTKRESSGTKTFVLNSAGTPASAWGRREISGPAACMWSNPPGRPLWFDQRVADAKVRTLQGCYSKVAEPDFLSLVTVKEAHKTASMIARPFAQASELLARINASAHRSVLYKGWTLSRALAAAWNEQRFGWKPLLFDIQGIWKAYVTSEVFKDKPVRLVARESDRKIDWLQSAIMTDQAQTGCRARMRADYTHTARVSSGVIYELRDSSHEAATARKMGLRLSDVPASIWELVPYSFVVDRFLDIGRWLNAITPKPGVTVVGSWTTSTVKQLNTHSVVECYIDFNPVINVRLSAGGGGTYSEEIHEVYRQPNPPFPALPTVNYRDLSLQQSIDHCALIISALGKLKIG